ncbi:MAG TPA: UDP-N-acetylmuramate--L-alanine ligase, partial [Actinomycetota bacterium]|nr:UDP-N-acetylmuramate--L-alanine ligase [Actinomycetota bacterium]
TAGHVIPGLALARALSRRGHEVTFLGTADRLEAELVPRAGFGFQPVRARPFVRRPSPAALGAVLTAVRAVGECVPLVRGAGALVGMGGYASVAPVLAARRAGVPVVLHEQNAVPGLANRALSRVAAAVALSFPQAGRGLARRGRMEVTGNPVREEVLRVRTERQALAREGRAELGLEAGRRTVLVFGGSQGALHLDRAAAGACRLLSGRADLQVLLITGPDHLEETRRGLPTTGPLLVRTLGYLDRMELAYACADLVVCRAGATTVAELTACGLPALLVPYPYATGRHQEANARALQRTGAASVLRDQELTAVALARRVESLVDHEERLRAMAERSRALGRPDAAERLADLVEEVSGAAGAGRRVRTPAAADPPPGDGVPDPYVWRSAHLVGIGGAGMSGIARLLLAAGVRVSGSDLKDSPGLAALREAGATVFVGHRAEQVGRPDAVVASSAIPPTNPELRAAREAGVPVWSRAQVLAGLMRGRRGVAVAGTHGKTTTTSMVSVMLSRLGLDPTFVVGGDLNESGSGASAGSGELFVAEADESDGSFLLLQPEVAVVTNVEEDHLDHYGGREEIERAFAAFAARARVVVACWDDPGARRALEGLSASLLRYGRGPEADVRVLEEELRPGRGSRSLVDVGGRRVWLELAVPGAHNVLNGAAALAVASVLQLDLEAAARALASFTGVRRRFERRGEAGGVLLVDDYAHHPTEVAATLAVAREAAPRRVVAVFQPHRYTRTRAMWRELGRSLAGADLVVLTDVYGAGERPIPGVSGKLVAEALAEEAPGRRVVYLPHRSDVAPFLAGEVRPGDLVLTIGAGDITMVGQELLGLLRERLGRVPGAAEADGRRDGSWAAEPAGGRGREGSTRAPEGPAGPGGRPADTGRAGAGGAGGGRSRGT